jgi:RNA polymerase subunit RPABC4/transcription elongation factor Spt4
MAYEAVVGLAILAVAIFIAWLLSRRSHKGADEGKAPCPHCGERIPRGASFCPQCSREILLCATCKTVILDKEGRCEVCGEMVTTPKAPVHSCPKCGCLVEANSKKCPGCGEQYWSPLISEQ